ncbi:hypothetical protein THRCLA_00867 [Thraustotheca clavata]|uniref:Lipoxygenase domain-containing protein n=1 Tax=Thraustotheca clavata TaxID=74557 RepID=A0A1W0AAT3_9STRA|nr:hypothetical protein THRCLA_00867 [Thraustotheca clavata]
MGNLTSTRPLGHDCANHKMLLDLGPEALKEFDAKLQNGSFVRQGAFPQGLLDLMGPILPTLDGAAHHAKKAAILEALNGVQVEKYKPVIRSMVQKAHARWSAQGGAMSLVANCKQLAFKLMLVVLLGLENDYDDHRDDHRELLDTYILSLRDSTHRADPDGVRSRQHLLDDMINPALQTSHERLNQNSLKPCVLDFLVSQKKLSDADLRIELFHLLTMGVGGLECWLANCITAAASSPDVLKQLTVARDTYLKKYSNEEDRWRRFDDLGYVNWYIQEVKRVYIAGPSHVYARSTAQVDIVTSDGTFRVPKGALVAAALDTTNKHPKVWTNPGEFNPNRFNKWDETKGMYTFCPHSVGSDRRCPGEQLSTVVLQSFMVSLFDFMWKMIPKQDYSLDTKAVNPMPRGGLMVVGFHRRTAASDDMVQVAGSEADWKFLSLPEAKVYADSKETMYEMFSDERLDVWTHLMIQLLSKKQERWNRPYANISIKVPQKQVKLKKVTLDGTKVEIPTEDEDWPSDPWFEVKTVEFLRDSCPMDDDFKYQWVPGEDKERYVMSKVGHMWPRVLVHWNDRYSDRALELLAFNGMGQHLVQKLEKAHDDGSYYSITLEFMQGIEVRPGYATYGADAFFNSKGKVTKIIRKGVTYRPKDDGWEYAKLCFRGSLNTRVTAVDHLLGIHLTVANYLVTSSREQLPPNHPLRRLIKPFTFRSVIVNFAASWGLIWPRAMLQRAFAVSEKGIDTLWKTGLASFKYEPFPEHMERQKVDTISMPFHEDGLDYWYICHTFVSDYLNLYYANDEALTQDTAVRAFWNFLNEKLPTGVRPLSLANLKDFITHAIVLVSAMHNHLGTLAEYVPDPAFCPSSWVEGEMAGRPGTSVRAALLMAATGFTQPAITEDISGIMLDDKAKAVCKRFSEALTKQIDVVNERNKHRVQIYQSMNPAVMEMAVSI